MLRHLAKFNLETIFPVVTSLFCLVHTVLSPPPPQPTPENLPIGTTTLAALLGWSYEDAARAWELPLLPVYVPHVEDLSDLVELQRLLRLPPFRADNSSSLCTESLPCSPSWAAEEGPALLSSKLREDGHGKQGTPTSADLTLAADADISHVGSVVTAIEVHNSSTPNLEGNITYYHLSVAIVAVSSICFITAYIILRFFKTSIPTNPLVYSVSEVGATEYEVESDGSEVDLSSTEDPHDSEEDPSISDEDSLASLSSISAFHTPNMATSVNIEGRSSSSGSNLTVVQTSSASLISSSTRSLPAPIDSENPSAGEGDSKPPSPIIGSAHSPCFPLTCNVPDSQLPNFHYSPSESFEAHHDEQALEMQCEMHPSSSDESRLATHSHHESDVPTEDERFGVPSDESVYPSSSESERDGPCSSGGEQDDSDRESVQWHGFAGSSQFCHANDIRPGEDVNGSSDEIDEVQGLENGNRTVTCFVPPSVAEIAAQALSAASISVPDRVATNSNEIPALEIDQLEPNDRAWADNLLAQCGRDFPAPLGPLTDVLERHTRGRYSVLSGENL
ncbi:hypothetical protein C0995_014112 [Termitomyces sp. Mi166|nr:hypothetical protein C0995_014112 [Termitomyces sp. Mi166\